MLAIKETKTSTDKNMNISDLQQKWNNRNILVVGSGATGLSCARFLSEHGFSFKIIDSRSNITDINNQFEIIGGDFKQDDFTAADILVVSPGVSVKHPYIQSAIKQGKEVIGDVEIFCRLANKPIVAITGSNGKTTVTTLVSEILSAQNLNVKTGGNIGVPCLELLGDDEPDCYVLELSSFQLETTSSLNAFVSVVLNLTEDHMDRYKSFAEYVEAKKIILRQAKNIVVNTDDSLVNEICEKVSANKITFAIDTNAYFTITRQAGTEWVVHKHKPLFDLSGIKIIGLHNKLNILAALSLCSLFDIDLVRAQQVINEFKGLPHRSQVVNSEHGVKWVNDSKATNIGATVAALAGFANESLFLILGGQAKGQNFSELLPALNKNIKKIVIYGEDRTKIFNELKGKTEVAIEQVQTLSDAVASINPLTAKDDVVLFSPACASFDQFENYMQRGDFFTKIVSENMGRVKS